MVIRVLAATGVRANREELRRLLEGVEGIALVGIAATAEQVVEWTCRLLPSVVLLDIAMAKRLALENHSDGAPRIRGAVILGTPTVYADVAACLPADVLAFVAQDAAVPDLVSAIRLADHGDHAADHAVPAETAGHSVRTPSVFAQLTEREMEILKLIQLGLPNKTISRHLDIGLSTVKNHVHSILAKLGVHNRSEAISFLYRFENSGDAARQAQPAHESGLQPNGHPAIA
jgi:DNA-binding NarL/FixJ family response regulator